MSYSISPVYNNSYTTRVKTKLSEIRKLLRAQTKTHCVCNLKEGSGARTLIRPALSEAVMNLFSMYTRYYEVSVYMEQTCKSNPMSISYVYSYAAVQIS